MAKPKKRKIDALSVHEALDRACIISDLIDEWLIKHHVIEQNPKLLKKAAKACYLLADLYQDIGGIDTDKLK